MINLIPASAQNEVKREYWVRVVSVWMFLAGTAFFIAAILHTPVYVLVQSQLDSFLVEFNQASDESQSFGESEALIENTNKVSALLAASGEAISFSSIIAELDNLTGNTVSIQNFSISRNTGVLNPIVIKGNADSRLTLSNFRDAIEASPLFLSADLPLANLAKDKDIPFTITITPNIKVKK